MTTSPRQDTQLIDIPPAGGYAIDPDRSEIVFRTRHLFGLAPVRGRFAVRGGRIEIDEPFERSRVHAEVDAGSVDTGTPARDLVVRSARYLRVAEHPVFLFDAAGVCREGGTWTVVGQLTVCGTARTVHLDLLAGSHTARTLEVRASTRIDRREFGITAQPGMTGRYLDLALLVVAHRVEIGR